MRIFIILFFALSFSLEAYTVDLIKVYKSEHLMQFFFEGKIVRSFKVMLGSGGPGPKRKEGDRLVPEGQYYIDDNNINSKFHKSLHISYPNQDDIDRAAKDGVNPGGEVFIHGLPNTKSKMIEWLREKLVLIKDKERSKKLEKILDWTKGCVAVSDKEIDEIFENIQIPTPIIIYP